jgi:DNA modification methylase
MRPEPVKDRPTKNYEQVLMFSKQRKYYYDPDPIRTPLISPSTLLAGKKLGVFRKDNNRTHRTYNNPMGGNAGSVWLAPPSAYRGSHAATMPEDIVRRCLLASCPDPSDDGRAGGSLQLGHRAISIDINPAYTREARQRIADAALEAT